MASIPVLSPITHTKPKRQALSFEVQPPLLCSSASFSTSRIQRGSKGGGALSSFASKKFDGFSHRRRREGQFSSFGVDEGAVVEVGERDWSQVLSASLPFVVAATGVVALAQPSTFTWLGFLPLHDFGFGLLLSICFRVVIYFD